MAPVTRSKKKKEENAVNYSETSYMDLPDDIHRHIFSFLDLPSSLRLRVNKRLNRLQLSVKHNIKKIDLKLRRSESQLTMDNHGVAFHSSFMNRCEQFLRRISLNTSVDKIWIYVETAMNEQSRRSNPVIDTLCHFKSGYLHICASTPNFCRLNLPSFLTLAQNVTKVDFHTTGSLTSQDLCTIRKTMMDGGCRMKSLVYAVEGTQKAKGFLKDCFGLTIKKILGPIRGRMYISSNDSIELYQKPAHNIQHFEGDLRTFVHICGPFRYISFKKVEVVDKPDDEHKIRLNHVYLHH